MNDAGDATVWIVASEGAAERWTRTFAETGAMAHPLPWGQAIAVGDPRIIADRLQAGPWAFVLLTSPNASRWLPAGVGAGHRAACVGAATAAAARAAGFGVDVVGAGGGADLAATLVQEHPPGRVLWLRGRDVVSGAEQRLCAAGFEVVSEVTYEVGERDDFAERVRAAPAPAAVAVGSPRGARALDAALRGDLAGLRARPALAVGRTTAGVLLELGFADVRLPDVPGAAGLAALAGAVIRGGASP